MSTPRTVDGMHELQAMTGQELGTTDWFEVGQEQVNLFADATGDHQWIHVDTERAADGPFGQTIAHGFLTLSMIPLVLPQVIDVQGFALGVNYGLDKVRFPAPVPVGRRIRATVTLTEVTEVAGGVQLVFDITFDIEGGDKPACAARFLARYYT